MTKKKKDESVNYVKLGCLKKEICGKRKFLVARRKSQKILQLLGCFRLAFLCHVRLLTARESENNGKWRHCIGIQTSLEVSETSIGRRSGGRHVGYGRHHRRTLSHPAV